MKQFRLSLFVVALFGLVGWGCEKDNLAPVSEETAEASVDTRAQSGNFLQDMKVTGVLADGRSIAGKVTVTSFGYDAVGGLLVSGEVKGTITGVRGKPVEFKQTFTDIEATLVSSSAGGIASSSHGCDILTLDIGAIFLDLLGLQLDIAPISIDLTAVPGSGNLLGNLLCAVAGLLDPGTGLLNELIGTLEDLLGLLNQINDLL